MTAYEDTAERQIERLHDEIEKLKELLLHADRCVTWETTACRSGFQEEIEAALGIGQNADQRRLIFDAEAVRGNE